MEIVGKKHYSHSACVFMLKLKKTHTHHLLAGKENVAALLTLGNFQGSTELLLVSLITAETETEAQTHPTQFHHISNKLALLRIISGFKVNGLLRASKKVVFYIHLSKQVKPLPLKSQ